jgi:maltose O-acetyltransferase
MSSLKTEKEKMILGELYFAEDLELIADRLHSAQLMHAYNCTAHDPLTHTPMLHQLLAECGENATIRPPFFCDYGYNIRLGANAFLNFNCVILDVTWVEIGDRTQIGPGVQIYAADHPRDPVARRAGLDPARCHYWRRRNHRSRKHRHPRRTGRSHRSWQPCPVPQTLTATSSTSDP